MPKSIYVCAYQLIYFTNEADCEEWFLTVGSLAYRKWRGRFFLTQFELFKQMLDLLRSYCWYFLSVSCICLSSNKETVFIAINNMRDRICTKVLANGKPGVTHIQLQCSVHLTLYATYVHYIYLLIYFSPFRLQLLSPRVPFRSHCYNPDVSIMGLVCYFFCL